MCMITKHSRHVFSMGTIVFVTLFGAIGLWGSNGRISWSKFDGDPVEGCSKLWKFGLIGYEELYDGCPEHIKDESNEYDAGNNCFDSKVCDECETSGATIIRPPKRIIAHMLLLDAGIEIRLMSTGFCHFISLLGSGMVSGFIGILLVQINKNRTHSNEDNSTFLKIVTAAALGMTSLFAAVCLFSWHDCHEKLKQFLIDNEYSGTLTLQMGFAMATLCMLASGTHHKLLKNLGFRKAAAAMQQGQDLSMLNRSPDVCSLLLLLRTFRIRFLHMR
eukprot:jgi/Bigna1/81402/fgenesh1_pg.80_\